MSDTATAAKATLSLIESAIKADFARDLVQPGWEDARTAFQEASRLLVRAGALSKTSDGWRFSPEALDGRGDDILAPIGAAGLSIAQALATPERVEALSADGKRGLLEASLAAADAQGAASGIPVSLDALRDAFAPAFQGLNGPPDSARTETSVTLEAPAETSAVPSPITQAQAKALLGAVDLGKLIADSAEIDTLEPAVIMFPREHVKDLGDALGVIDQAGADIALAAAREEGRPLPGVSDDAMKGVGDLVQALRDVRLSAQPRGEGFVAVSQEHVDRITSLTDRILYSGAREGLAAAAGESEASATPMTEGRDSVDIAPAAPTQPTLSEVPSAEGRDNADVAPAARAQPTLSEVPSAERLHGVATASLGLLEAFYNTGASLPNTRDGRRALELQQALEGALRDGDFALPGEILGRTTPYAAQAPRGDRAQQMAIFAAAGAYAHHLRATNLAEEIEVSGGPLARAGLIRKFQDLDGALESARAETPVALDTPAAAPAVPSPISQAQAKALLSAVDLGNRIADSAQLDTLEPEMVMFPRAHLKALGDVLGVIDQAGANIALAAAREEGRLLPGVSDGAMKAVGDLVQEMRDIRLDVQPRGEGFVAVSQEHVDRITSLTDRILYSGAREGLAAAAGESETSAISMTEGRDSAAFATLQEAMRGGARLGNPESALGTLGKILPEMDFAEWNALSPRLRSTAQAVFVEPGKGDFAGLDIATAPGAFFDPRACEGQEKALRNFVRRQVLDETPLENGKGTVGERFRDRVLNARHRTIVAPTRGLAKAYREEGERIAAELTRQKRESSEMALSKLERVPADFDRSQVARFLRVVEAQGASSPASLVKTGDHLIMTHSDGPTLKADIGAVGALARHQDGHTIAKIPLESLRGAVETGQAKVRVVVTEDRVAAIIGHTPATERSRARGDAEIAA